MKLKNADPDVAGSDYINANYIRRKSDDATVNLEHGDSNEKVYIATQGECSDYYFASNPVLFSFVVAGCLPSTIPDFWQMVWQENCRVIVMTTKEIERGKVSFRIYRLTVK